MADFEKFLPKAKPRERTIKAVMVRPPVKVCEFLVRKSNLHGVSVNQICVAILEAAMERDEKE